jgi:hypothetical protein
VSRPSRRPPAKRLAALAAGASLLAAAGVAATAGSASADTVLNVHYALTGTTFINKLSTTVNLGSGTPAATVDLTTGTSTALRSKQLSPQLVPLPPRKDSRRWQP